MKTKRAGIFIGLLVLAVAALFLWSRVRGFLEGEEFRRLVEEFAGGTVRGEAVIEPLRWDGAHVETVSLRLTGGEGSKVRSIHAENLRAKIDWAAVLSGAWRVEKFLAKNLRAEFGEGEATQTSNDWSPSAALAILPSRFEMGVVVIDRADLDFGETEIQKTALEVRPEGRGWKFNGSGGQFVCPWLPPLVIESFQADWSEGRVSVNTSSLKLGANGKISSVGKWPGAMEVKWSDVLPSDFPGGKWGANLDGKLAGSAQVEAERVKGNFEWSGGSLRGVPILEKAADFTGREEFRRFPISKSTADFEIQNGNFAFRNVILESAGLLRVEGSLSISKNKDLLGELQVGVPPALLNGIPGARSRVFTREADGFVWTPVSVGGSIDAPTENLSSRLVAAAGGAALEAVAPVMQSVPEPARKAVDETINTLFDILGR
jgi:hypothetical protein